MGTRQPAELKRRIVIAKTLIKLIKNDPELLGDKRQPEALREYNAQLLKLEKELYTIIKPQPIVVGLQAATLSAKSSNIQE